MTPKRADHKNPKEESLAREIALQAELLALNVAVGGQGAPQASQALYALSRELRQARPGVRAVDPAARAGWRLER
jgi:hypothetical protein